MSFQIINQAGEPLTMHQLDEEAATFWGKPVEKKSYASPGAMSQKTNWFDAIGYNIHNPEVTGWGQDWKAVKMSMTQVHFNFALSDYFSADHSTEALKKRLDGALAYNKDYFDLIDHWDAKGYKPKRIED